MCTLQICGKKDSSADMKSDKLRTSSVRRGSASTSIDSRQDEIADSLYAYGTLDFDDEANRSRDTAAVNEDVAAST